MQIVSIIIPMYNSAALLPQTLESILAQSSPYWEAILVDDGSTDATETIVKSYSTKDHRFQYCRRPENKPKGPSSSRNFGLEIAQGEYVVFLDSDDLLAPDCIENRVKAMQQNPNCDFVVFQMQRFLNQPDFSKKENETERHKQRILESFIQLHGQWPITSPIYKSSFFREIGFNNELIVFEDLEAAIKAIVLAKDFEIFDRIDCYYRNDENYKTKYNSLEVKAKTVKGFQTLVLGLADLLQRNSENQFKNASLKSYLVQSYKKIFRFTILENSRDFKEDNKRLLNLLTENAFLTNTEIFKFFFVDRILLPFAILKGSGISRLIKFIYK